MHSPAGRATCDPIVSSPHTEASEVTSPVGLVTSPAGLVKPWNARMPVSMATVHDDSVSDVRAEQARKTSIWEPAVISASTGAVARS